MPPNREEINAAFDRAVADVIGDDAVRLRVPASRFAHIMRTFVFSATHPLITGGRPLDAEEIVAVLLDGVLDHSPTRTPPTTEDHAC
ncbi:hypothetical protein BJF78_06135 [Pseudonocardia sp. CNS-139]|nr:hypothetical protein BJF78_06135 [Pseudonocardia sp. CNS-139]